MSLARIAIAAFVLGSAATAASAADPPILAFEDVRAGMKGTGRTVFDGTTIETFDVEVVGTLPNIGPDQNLILARCSGGPLAQTGILAGMSGSPVFIEDKLVGAVAYSWGFSKEAIAGITPIQEMLAVARRERGGLRAGDGLGATGIPLATATRPEALERFLEQDLPRRMFAASDPARVPGVPISIAGMGASGIRRIAGDLARFGMTPVQGGGSGAAAAPSPALQPGAAVGLKLVRGDVDMTATGTVTWVDGSRVLAFGHPLFGLGSVALPLTGARVEALLPSLSQSLRLATPLSEIGTLVEDRTAAVLGTLGAAPRMIPVRLRLSRAGKDARAYSFDVADDPLLAPILLYVSLNGILASTERMDGAVTLSLLDGSTIQTKDQPDVRLDNVFAGSTAPFFATGTSAFLLYLLLNNDLTPPKIDGINLVLDYDVAPRSARLRRVTLDRYRVRAGAELEATIVLTPFRGPDRVLHRAIRIPVETPPGPLTLHVGSGALAGRAENADTPPVPTDLAQLIQLINRLPRNDRVYLVAAREDNGVFLGGSRLSNLPPSVATVLTRPRNRGNFATVSQRSVLEEILPVEYQVDGVARLQVEVEAP
jgi:hypothetical protein